MLIQNEDLVSTECGIFRLNFWHGSVYTSVDLLGPETLKWRTAICGILIILASMKSETGYDIKTRDKVFKNQHDGNFPAAHVFNHD
jgi:hypothetical protein